MSTAEFDSLFEEVTGLLDQGIAEERLSLYVKCKRMPYINFAKRYKHIQLDYIYLKENKHKTGLVHKEFTVLLGLFLAGVFEGKIPADKVPLFVKQITDFLVKRHKMLEE